MGEGEAEDLFEGGFVGGLEGASVDEEGGSAFDFERFAFGDVGFDGGFSGGIGHAGVEGIGRGACGDGVLREHVPGVVGRDGGLIGEDGVLEFEEGGVVGSFVDAASRERGGHGPGMELFEREIFEDPADLGKFGLDLLENVVSFLTMGAFEVAEFDDGEFGAGGAF